MNQSKKQHKKVELQLPDYISIDRYETWLRNETHKTLVGKLFACEALTLNTIEEIKSISPHLWERFYETATDQLLGADSLVPLMIRYKGEVVGVNRFSQKSIGEVAETEIMISGGDIKQIARTMLTPIEEYSVKDEEWMTYGEDDDGNTLEVIYSVNMEHDSKKYKTKEYSIENLLPESYFQHFPIKLYTSTLDFILRAGISAFTQTSAPSSSKQIEATKSLFSEMIKIQVGLRRSFILERLTS